MLVMMSFWTSEGAKPVFVQPKVVDYVAHRGWQPASSDVHVWVLLEFPTCGLNGFFFSLLPETVCVRVEASATESRCDQRGGCALVAPICLHTIELLLGFVVPFQEPANSFPGRVRTPSLIRSKAKA